MSHRSLLVSGLEKPRATFDHEQVCRVVGEHDLQASATTNRGRIPPSFLGRPRSVPRLHSTSFLAGTRPDVIWRRRELPTARYSNRNTSTVEHRHFDGIGQHLCWRRTRHLTRPRLLDPRGRRRWSLFAQVDRSGRNQHDLFRWRSTATPLWNRYRLSSQQPLQPRYHPSDIVSPLCSTTPETQLTTRGWDDFIGNQREASNAVTGFGDVVDFRRSPGRHAEPAIELPTSSVGQSWRRQCTLVPPQANMFFTRVGLGFDRHSHTRQTIGGESCVQFVSQRLGCKRTPINGFCRRLEHPGDRHVGGGPPQVGRVVVVATGQAMGQLPFTSESADHITCWQRSEISERRQTEAFQHLGQRSAIKRRDRETLQEVRACSRLDHHGRLDRRSRSRSQTGGENAISHPDSHLSPPAKYWRHILEHLGHHVVVAPEESRGPAGGERQQPRSDHLDSGSQALERCSHRLEQPSLTINVTLEHSNIWAAALRVTAPLTQCHTFTTSSR